LHHGVALLRGISTPSLAAQGGQRLPSYFNIGRDIPFIGRRQANEMGRHALPMSSAHALHGGSPSELT
jgi:hypothetical protein